LGLRQVAVAGIRSTIISLVCWGIHDLGYWLGRNFRDFEIRQCGALASFIVYGIAAIAILFCGYSNLALNITLITLCISLTHFLADFPAFFVDKEDSTGGSVDNGGTVEESEYGFPEGGEAIIAALKDFMQKLESETGAKISEISSMLCSFNIGLWMAGCDIDKLTLYYQGSLSASKISFYKNWLNQRLSALGVGNASTALLRDIAQNKPAHYGNMDMQRCLIYSEGKFRARGGAANDASCYKMEYRRQLFGIYERLSDAEKVVLKIIHLAACGLLTLDISGWQQDKREEFIGSLASLSASFTRLRQYQRGYVRLELVEGDRESVGLSALWISASASIARIKGLSLAQYLLAVAQDKEALRNIIDDLEDMVDETGQSIDEEGQAMHYTRNAEDLRAAKRNVTEAAEDLAAQGQVVLARKVGGVVGTVLTKEVRVVLDPGVIKNYIMSAVASVDDDFGPELHHRVRLIKFIETKYEIELKIKRALRSINVEAIAGLDSESIFSAIRECYLNSIDSVLWYSRQGKQKDDYMAVITVKFSFDGTAFVIEIEDNGAG
jgi:hypothetical protein